MNKHEVALGILAKEYAKLGGVVFSEYFSRNKGNDEQKKAIQANDFIEAMLTGKNLNVLKEEWSIEKSESYQQMANLVQTINQLQKEHE